MEKMKVIREAMYVLRYGALIALIAANQLASGFRGIRTQAGERGAGVVESKSSDDDTEAGKRVFEPFFSGRVLQSIRELQDKTAKEPRALESLLVLSELHVLGGREDLARRQAARVLELLESSEGPDAQDLVAGQGLHAIATILRQGRGVIPEALILPALTRLEAAHGSDPESSFWSYWLAIAHSQLHFQHVKRTGSFDESENSLKALELCRLIDEHEADEVIAHVLVGDINRDLGRFEDSKKPFLRVITSVPGHGVATILLTNILIDECRYAGIRESGELAVTLLREASSCSADKELILGQLAAALGATGRHQDALKAIKAHLEHYPESSKAYGIMGDVYGALGNWSAAIASYDKSIELWPDNIAAIDNRGVVFGNAGNYQEQLKCSLSALAKAPWYHFAHLNAAAALGNLNRNAEAFEILDSLIRILPYWEIALRNHAISAVAIGKQDEARRSVRTLLSVNPHHPEAPQLAQMVGIRR